MDSFQGLGVSAGTAIGRARVIRCSSEINDVRKGEIIVVFDATAHLVPAILIANATISERGGITSHLAIVSREFAKPCVVGVKYATSLISTGLRLSVNGYTGEIEVLC